MNNLHSDLLSCVVIHDVSSVWACIIFQNLLTLSSVRTALRSPYSAEDSAVLRDSTTAGELRRQTTRMVKIILRSTLVVRRADTVQSQWGSCSRDDISPQAMVSYSLILWTVYTHLWSSQQLQPLCYRIRLPVSLTV